MARRAADFGVAVGGSVSMDMKQVKARKDAVVGRSNRSIEQWLRGMKGCTVYTGYARFVAPHEVAVDGEVLAAKNIHQCRRSRRCPTCPASIRSNT